jgi:hypothetical protein
MTLTPSQFMEWMKQNQPAGDHALRTCVQSVEEQVIDGVLELVVHLEGVPDGVVLDKMLAEQLTEHLGRHPLVDKYFGLPTGGHS